VTEQNDGHPIGHRDNEPDRVLTASLRWAVLPTLSVPASLAALGASATGPGIPVTLAWPVAALALIASAVCWWRVVCLWRALPRRDDDEQDWRRWSDGDPRVGPHGGPGGITFDWTSFEQQFWSHVLETQHRRELEKV
jgi:hypothetical protein